MTSPGDPRPKLFSGPDFAKIVADILADIRRIKKSIIGVARTTIDAGIAAVNYNTSTVNTVYAFAVTFNKAFESPPVVTLNPVVTNPQVVQCSAAAVTTTGFNIYLRRTDAANATNVGWVAVDTAY